MNFRLKALSFHLLASAVALIVIVGGLYAGWYRGPGWYLSGVARVVLLMSGVDVVLGPLLTFVVASPGKPRRDLLRDLGVIAAIQLVALGYGAALLWKGRPLYYAYSECCLTLVQSYDLDPVDTALARQRDLALAPHWYNLPRWVWAPLPEDPAESGKIVAAAISGEYDVTAMPTHYRPWNEGLPILRKQLMKLDETRFFLPQEKKILKQRMQAAGIALGYGEHPAVHTVARARCSRFSTRRAAKSCNCSSRYRREMYVEIISATRQSPQEFQSSAALGRSLARIAHDARMKVRVATSNRRGLPLVYNEMLDSAAEDSIVVFMHDDIWIDDYYLIDRVVAGLERFDVIGIAGNRRRSADQPAWHFANMAFEWDEPQYLSGVIAHGASPGGEVSHYGAAPAACELLDGVFLAAKKSTLATVGARFDPPLRLSFLRHGLLPHRPAAGTAARDLAHLPHPSRRKPVRHAGLAAKSCALSREVG